MWENFLLALVECFHLNTYLCRIGPDGGQDISRTDQELWGILPRAADYLFGELADKAQDGLLSYHVKASFLQIYNENLYDLLSANGGAFDDDQIEGARERDTGLKIREIPKPGNNRSFNTEHGKRSSVCHEVYVSGLSEFRVQTSEDVFRILAAGIANRTTRSTDYNATSSRSHAILQVRTVNNV